MAPKAGATSQFTSVPPTSPPLKGGMSLFVAGCWELSLPCAVPTLYLGFGEDKWPELCQELCGQLRSVAGLGWHPALCFTGEDRAQPPLPVQLGTEGGELGAEGEELVPKSSSGPGMGRISLWKCLVLSSDSRGSRPPCLHPLSGTNPECEKGCRWAYI